MIVLYTRHCLNFDCLMTSSSVFDVTKGRSHYGPGGGYHHFAGRLFFIHMGIFSFSKENVLVSGSTELGSI